MKIYCGNCIQVSEARFMVPLPEEDDRGNMGTHGCPNCGSMSWHFMHDGEPTVTMPLIKYVNMQRRLDELEGV